MTNKKYIKRITSVHPQGNIHSDYEHYLMQEKIYSVLWGNHPAGYRRASYIWKALLREYGRE